jgi:hypothetical protein
MDRHECATFVVRSMAYGAWADGVRSPTRECKGVTHCKPPMPWGSAAVRVGPEAVTLAVMMNKSLGLPHADAAAISAATLWIDDEPGRDLPGDPAGGA